MIVGVPVRVAPRMTDCDRCAVAGADPLQGAGVQRLGAAPRCASTTFSAASAAGRRVATAATAANTTWPKWSNTRFQRSRPMVRANLVSWERSLLTVARPDRGHRGPRRACQRAGLGAGHSLPLPFRECAIAGRSWRDGADISALTRRIGVRIFRTSVVLTSETGRRSTRGHVYRPMLRHEFCACHQPFRLCSNTRSAASATMGSPSVRRFLERSSVRHSQEVRPWI